jgi:hypothetical protein
MDATALVMDSVTHLAEEAAGRVACCASHGGVYAAWYAARKGVAAMVLHDAGIGRDRAGIAGLDFLAGHGVPGATVDFRSARIGDGADMVARGRLSFVNAPAAALGLEPGMGCGIALQRLLAARPPPPPPLQPMGESRKELPGARGIRVFAIDSNGLVLPADAGRIVVTGSHGGLLGGRPETAVKSAVLAALYNDAGIGIDDAGISRLPALQARGIAGATVDCHSARIGEGMSSWEDGVISVLNERAAARGGRVGQSARDFVAAMLEHAE